MNATRCARVGTSEHGWEHEGIGGPGGMWGPWYAHDELVLQLAGVACMFCG